MFKQESISTFIFELAVEVEVERDCILELEFELVVKEVVAVGFTNGWEIGVVIAIEVWIVVASGFWISGANVFGGNGARELGKSVGAWGEGKIPSGTCLSFNIVLSFSFFLNFLYLNDYRLYICEWLSITHVIKSWCRVSLFVPCADWRLAFFNRRPEASVLIEKGSMQCRACNIAKLSSEFPKSKLSPHCQHRVTTCLRVNMSICSSFFFLSAFLIQMRSH